MRSAFFVLLVGILLQNSYCLASELDPSSSSEISHEDDSLEETQSNPSRQRRDRASEGFQMPHSVCDYAIIELKEYRYYYSCALLATVLVGIGTSLTVCLNSAGPIYS